LCFIKFSKLLTYWNTGFSHQIIIYAGEQEQRFFE